MRIGRAHRPPRDHRRRRGDRRRDRQRRRVQRRPGPGVRGLGPVHRMGRRVRRPRRAHRPAGAEELGAPVLAPPQVFGIGLNYREHAAESGVRRAGRAAGVHQYRQLLAGPSRRRRAAQRPGGLGGQLVAVIGRPAERGRRTGLVLCRGRDGGSGPVGADGQLATSPQFSLGKSFPGFGPIGPSLVTPDELPDRDDLRLRCSVAGSAGWPDQGHDLLRS